MSEEKEKQFLKDWIERWFKAEDFWKRLPAIMALMEGFTDSRGNEFGPSKLCYGCPYAHKMNPHGEQTEKNKHKFRCFLIQEVVHGNFPECSLDQWQERAKEEIVLDKKRDVGLSSELLKDLLQEVLFGKVKIGRKDLFVLILKRKEMMEQFANTIFSSDWKTAENYKKLQQELELPNSKLDFLDAMEEMFFKKKKRLKSGLNVVLLEDVKEVLKIFRRAEMRKISQEEEFENE